MKNNLKKIRKEQDFTIKELAKKTGIKVSKIKSIEEGRSICGADDAFTLSKVLNTEIKDIFDK